MGIRLTPLASLCLGVVRGWINVARKGRGGQIDESGTAWTRLPADQLRDQLEREFLVEVSTRSIQRALKELEEANQIRREQRWKHRYKRDYWYALPEEQEALEQHRPRVVASRFRSERLPQRSTYEPTRAAGQVLTTPTTNTQVLRPQPKNQQPERKDPIRIAVEACMRKGRTKPTGTPTLGLPPVPTCVVAARMAGVYRLSRAIPRHSVPLWSLFQPCIPQ